MGSVSLPLSSAAGCLAAAVGFVTMVVASHVRTGSNWKILFCTSTTIRITPSPGEMMPMRFRTLSEFPRQTLYGLPRN